MMEETVMVKRDFGHEAQSTARLVQVANSYDSSLYIETEDKRVNLKSIMGVMSLTLDLGDKVTVKAEGGDEEQALCGVGNFLTAAAS